MHSLPSRVVWIASVARGRRWNHARYGTDHRSSLACWAAGSSEFAVDGPRHRGLQLEHGKLDPAPLDLDVCGTEGLPEARCPARAESRRRGPPGACVPELPFGRAEKSKKSWTRSMQGDE
jgi:hypothetical protein